MKKITVCVFLGVAVLGVYANTLDNGFVFDDYFMVLENRAIRLPLSEWPQLFFGVNGGVGVYRPLRTLSYAIDYRLGGFHPFIYHLSNIAYHWLTACLVFLVTVQLGAKREKHSPLDAQPITLTIAASVALLWALHPVQTDSVAYISGRRDIVAGLFFFLSFYAFLRLRAVNAVSSTGKRWGWGALALLGFGCGALAKEAAFVLPLIFFAYDLCQEHVPGHSLWRSLYQSGWRHRWLYGPLLIVAIGSLWYYAPYLSIILTWHGDGPLTTWATVPRIWMYYVKLLLFPFTLNADYSDAFPLSSSLLEWNTLGATLGLVLLIAAVCWGLQRGYRLAAFCGLWFMITLLPVSHILPHPELLAEHYLYLPSFGFCLLIGLGFGFLVASPVLPVVCRASGGDDATYTRPPTHWQVMAGYGVLAALLVFYGARTAIRNQDWQDELTLWRKTATTAPGSARAHHNLGVALQQTGKDFGAAEEEFRQALAIDPTYGAAYTGLAEVYLASLKFDDALRAAQKGVELRPRRAWSHWVLGVVHFRRGEYAQALSACHRVVELWPHFTPAHHLIVLLYRTEGEEKKAQEWQSRFPLPSIPLAVLLPGGLEGKERPAPR